MSSGDMPAANSTVRAAGLQCYPELLTELGCDVEAALTHSGLSLVDLAIGDQYLPYRSVLAAIQYPAKSYGIADFGMRLAARQDANFLGPISLMAMHAETPLEAFSDIAAYASFHSGSIRLAIREEAEADLLTLRIQVDQIEKFPQGLEHALSILVKLCRRMAVNEDALVQLAANLSHSQISADETYRHYLGMLPIFDRSSVSLRLPHVFSRAGIPTANRHLHELTKKVLMNLAPTPAAGTIRTLKTMLIQALPNGGMDLSMAATQLNVHTRTLQRRLQSEGTTFECVRDDARKELFTKLVYEARSLAELAQTLGFSDQAVLTRACKSWFGMSPRQYRKS